MPVATLKIEPIINNSFKSHFGSQQGRGTLFVIGETNPLSYFVP